MRCLLVTFVSFLAAGAGQAAEFRTADKGAPWCSDIVFLRPYILARANGNAAAMAQFDTCTVLPGGLSVEVMSDSPGLGGKIHVLQVRVYRDAASAVGFMLGNGLVPK